MTEQFYHDCAEPTAVSGWVGSEGSWHVAAFRCKDPVPGRITPDPWLSDGWLFLWASRGTLVIEVVSRQGARPSAKEWRAYLDKAIALEPPLHVPHADGGAPPTGAVTHLDRKQIEALLAKLRRLAVRVPGGSCSRVQAEYESLGAELDRIVPSGVPPSGVLEEAVHKVADCRMCGGPGHRCSDALAAIQRAHEWALRNAR